MSTPQSPRTLRGVVHRMPDAPAGPVRQPPVVVVPPDDDPPQRGTRGGAEALALALTVGGALALAVGGAPGVAALAYPALAFVCGAALYRHRPVGYIAFVWGLLLVTPWVRRVVDLQLGAYSSVSLVMLAPYLVAGLAVLSLLRSRRALSHRVFKPYLLALLAVAWGFAAGVVQNGAQAAAFDLLEWSVPIFFGLHTALAWRDYPELRRALGRVFGVGVAVVGVYGIVQFVALPAWDRLWMLGSGMYDASGPYVITYIGLPEPYQVRVFSTLNAPGPNAMILMSGLLLLFGLRGPWRWLAAAPGYVTLLLSLVRSAWGGWVVGVGYLFVRGARAVRLQTLAGAAALVVLAAGAIATVPAVRDAVAARLVSAVDLGDDTSLRERSEFVSEVLWEVATHPLGHGLGSTGTSAKLSSGATLPFDNGVVNVPYVLGWFGGALFFLGPILLAYRAARSSRRDPFSTAAEAAALGMLAQIIFVNTLVSTVGFVFWCFMGVSIARAFWSDHGPDVGADY